MATSDFRAQARAVRAEARRKLMDYRRERRAGMRTAQHPVSPTAPVDAALDVQSHEPVATPDTPDVAPDMHDDRPAAMQVSAVAAAFAEAAALGQALDPPPAPVAAQEAEPSATEDDAAAQPDRDPEVAAPPAAQEPDGPAADEVETAAPAALDSLPGVGPGLVWLLEKAGVDSIDALMTSDTQALSERLGLVGRLVDVAALQVIARSARH